MGQVQGPDTADSVDDYSDAEDESCCALTDASRTRVLSHVRAPRSADGEDGAQAELVLLGVPERERGSLRLAPETVLLHVYDLRPGALQAANHALTFLVEEISLGGAFHAAVEVFGSEWSYGGLGVHCELPRSVGGYAYRCSYYMGRTQLSQEEVAAVLYEACRSWRGDDYDIVGRNCCSFAADLCQRLGVGEIPAWVDRFARLLNMGRSAMRGERLNLQALAEDLLSQSMRIAPLPSEDDSEQSQVALPEGFVIRGNRVSKARLGPEHCPRAAGKAGTDCEDFESPYARWHESGPEAMVRVKVGDAEASASAEMNAFGGAGAERASVVDGVAQPVTCAGYAGKIVDYGAQPPTYRGRVRAAVLAAASIYDDLDLDASPNSPAGGSAPSTTPSASLALPPARTPSPLPLAPTKAEVAAAPATAALLMTDAKAPLMTDAKAALGAAGDPGPLLPGQRAEYLSDTHGGCVPTEVLAFHPSSGRYDLTCRTGAAAERVRRPFAVGTRVDYASASAGGRWVPGKILAFNEASGLYDLDCKPAVSPLRLRLRGEVDAGRGA